MSNDPSNGWCDSHRERLSTAGDARMVVETLIIKRAMETGCWPPADTGCWVCGVTEDDFQAAMREGVIIHAKAEAFGGTYTAAGIALSLGKK